MKNSMILRRQGILFLSFILTMAVNGCSDTTEYPSWTPYVDSIRYTIADCSDSEDSWDVEVTDHNFAITEIDSLVDSNCAVKLTDQGYYVPTVHPEIKYNHECSSYEFNSYKERSVTKIKILISDPSMKNGSREFDYDGDYTTVLKAYRERLPVNGIFFGTVKSFGYNEVESQ